MKKHGAFMTRGGNRLYRWELMPAWKDLMGVFRFSYG
jgi:hypothetical protein